MQDDTLQKALTAEELVSKKDIELLQLKAFYEKKYQNFLKFDILLGLRKWVSKHFKICFIITILSFLLTFLFFYLAIKMNKDSYLIPFVIGFVWLIFMGIVNQRPKQYLYKKNVDTINLILLSRKELLKDKTASDISKKTVEIYSILDVKDPTKIEHIGSKFN
jgi:hypothetical protein